MNNLIDAIVSNTWLAILATIVICFVFFGVWLIRPFKSKIFTRILQVAVSIFSFIALLYMHLGPSGVAANFIGGMSNGKEICLIEKHFVGDGDGGEYEVFRLYVLDTKTGKQLNRMTVESAELLLVKEKSVIFFEWDGAVEYDMFNGDILHKWSKEGGFEKYPELASGIQDLNRDSENYRNINNAYLTITAKNGHTFCLDLMTETLIECKQQQQLEGDYRFDEYSVSHMENNSPRQLFSFENTTGEIKRLKKNSNYNEGIYYDAELLNPDFVFLDEDNHFFILKHFETLENTNAILTAITFDLTKKWEVQQKEIDVIDKYDKAPIIGQCFEVNKNLIVTYGGFVVYLNVDNGEIIWKVRL